MFSHNQNKQTFFIIKLFSLNHFLISTNSQWLPDLPQFGFDLWALVTLLATLTYLFTLTLTALLPFHRLSYLFKLFLRSSAKCIAWASLEEHHQHVHAHWGVHFLVTLDLRFFPYSLDTRGFCALKRRDSKTQKTVIEYIKVLVVQTLPKKQKMIPRD